jgi:hypothetical protein
LLSPECKKEKNVKTDTGPFENVETFKDLGTTVTNQNLIYKEINSLKTKFLLKNIYIQFVPHMKHITSPLQDQPVNSVWGNSRYLV